MATGEILLPVPPHGFDASAPADMLLENGFLYPAFDAATPEGIYWSFQMPADYASGLTLELIYSMASATSGKVEFEASIWANADGEATGTESYDTANVGTAPTVPGTARLQDTYSITLTNADSIAASEACRLKVFRDADDATNDTATGDCYLHSAKLTYTTT